jgi:hypothetical protein
MKKIVLMASIMMGVMFSVHAQSSVLKDYFGKYTFPEGSPVTEVSITAEDTVLTINSAMGSTALDKKGIDTFYLAAYDAPVVFKRDANNVVVSVSILVQGMELVGKKVSATTAYIKEDFYHDLWSSKCE